MKKILCFGDSNTWGYAPSGKRYKKRCRWPGVLAKQLAPAFTVIEAGLPGRTSERDMPYGDNDLILPKLKGLVAEHRPELVVIALGTNDFLSNVNMTVEKTIRNLIGLVGSIREIEEASGQISEIILVSPTEILPEGEFTPMFNAPQIALQAIEVENVAAQNGLGYVDARQHAEPDHNEGVHWTESAHEKFGLKIAEVVVDRLASPN
ncbi:GDSL-type esterase/lipase family protein [Corallincola platygyrae]|uniref:GDSL-type esterase/lipase family protein n=1 Tax=Corallincola platygyrae TaxID=1193278 RepID=A0ABW4XLG6_9GAMM